MNGEVRSSRAGIGIGLSLGRSCCCCYSSTPSSSSIQETVLIGGNLGSRYYTGMSSSSQDQHSGHSLVL